MTAAYHRPTVINRRRVHYGRVASGVAIQNLWLDQPQRLSRRKYHDEDNATTGSHQRSVVRSSDRAKRPTNRHHSANTTPAACPNHHAKRQRNHWLSLAIMTLCMLVFVSSLTYAGCKYFLTKGHEQEKLQRALETQTPEDIQAAEGTDESDVSDDDINNYHVPADHPRIITIPAANVHAKVLSLGRNPDQSIQAPTNIHDTGWYNASAKPGQPGTTLIDGHDVGATKSGVFAKLDSLSIGSNISLELGNGQTLSYTVTSSQTVELSQVDMSTVLGHFNNGQSGLVLITCHGKVTKDNGAITQTHRIIIYAKLDT